MSGDESEEDQSERGRRDDVGSDGDERDERDERDEVDRAAILSRRQRLLVGALAGLAVTGASEACRERREGTGQESPPTMTAGPAPSACLEVYVPPPFAPTAPVGTAVPCLSVAIGAPPAPMPCLRPPAMPCLSPLPPPPRPRDAGAPVVRDASAPVPVACLSVRRPPATRRPPGAGPAACLSVDPFEKPGGASGTSDHDDNNDERES